MRDYLLHKNIILSANSKNRLVCLCKRRMMNISPVKSAEDVNVSITVKRTVDFAASLQWSLGEGFHNLHGDVVL